MHEQLLIATGQAILVLWEALVLILVFLTEAFMADWAAWVGAIGSIAGGAGAVITAWIAARSARRSEAAIREANDLARVRSYRDELVDVKNSLVWLCSQFQMLSQNPQYGRFYLDTDQRDTFENYCNQAMRHMSLLDAVVPGYKEISFDISRLWPKARVNLFRNADPSDRIIYPDDVPNRVELINQLSKLIDRIDEMMSV